MKWPPKSFGSMTKDQKLLEAEYAAMMFVRSSSPESKPMHRARTSRQFQFSHTAWHLSLSPKKLSPPLYRSRVYLYQVVRKIALSEGSPSSEDRELIEFLEAGMGRRNNHGMDC